MLGSKQSEGFNVIYVYADNQYEWNCSQWRMLTPSNALNRAGNGWKAKLIHVSGFMFFLDPAIQDLVGPADLIILQRNIVNEEVINAMQYWQGMGKPVVVDLDDAYQMLPWSNSAKKFWHLTEGGKYLQIMLQGLRVSNGLVSPNRLLLSDLSMYARGYYLQNYAEKAWWENLPSRKDMKREKGLSDRIVIGWGGSLSHYDSWWGSGLREAASAVSKRHRKVIWMICGSDPRIYNQLKVPKHQKYMQPGVPPSEWPKVVKTFDIGVAPLFGAYDHRRSWIKGIEYALAGVPWIAQEGPVYAEIENLGHLIPATAEAWEDALEDMLKNLKYEQERSEAIIPMAQENFFVDNQIHVFGRVYRQIIQDFNDDASSLPQVFRIKAKEEKVAA